MKRLGIAGVVAIGGLTSCLHPNFVECDDGTACPASLACAREFELCVAPSQLADCEGQPDRTPCTLPSGAPGNCQGTTHVCLEIACGNQRLDLGEACDVALGGQCSTDCSSTGTCGNGIVDIFTGEECDSSTELVDHDGCTSRCKREVLDWTTTEMLPSRTGAAGAYDPRRDRVVMFGGLDAGNQDVAPDTWEWDGATWRAAATSPPPPRAGAGAIYDGGRKAVVIIGGRDSLAVRSDVWAFDGLTWSLLPPLPVATTQMSVAYDSRRDRIVVFGGAFRTVTTNTDKTFVLEANATAWVELQPTTHPTKHRGMAMTYDPIRDRIVAFGGLAGLATLPSSATWEFDGTEWMQVASTGPSGVAFGSLTFDRRLGVSVLVGGSLGSTISTEAWAWNGSQWSLLESIGGLHRSQHIAAETERGVFVFGGGASESYAPGYLVGGGYESASPTVASQFLLAQDLIGGRVLLHGGFTSAHVWDPSTWMLDARGWHRQSMGSPFPPDLMDSKLAFDRARSEFVLFGGSDNDSVENPTWTWTAPTGWQAKVLTIAPRARINHAMVYDAARAQTLVLLGDGYDARTIPADMWAWDGSTWTNLTPADPMAMPSRRKNVAIGYDEVAHKVILFGGSAYLTLNITYYDDTWIWDGTSWTKAPTPPDRPSTATDAVMSWDPARQRLVLSRQSSPVFDAWAWNDGAMQWERITTPHLAIGRNQFGAFTSLDGTGVTLFRGTGTGNGASPERSELRSTGPGLIDHCETSFDGDGDGLAGCADLDCWTSCSPACPPASSCDPTAGAHCGDGVCGVTETCRICPGDCAACPSLCGDLICDPGEECLGDCP